MVNFKNIDKKHRTLIMRVDESTTLIVTLFGASHYPKATIILFER